VIHLDTSFLIRALVRHAPEDRRLRHWLRDGEPLAMSAVAWAEFRCGPLPLRDAELAARLLADVPAFTLEDAALAADLFNATGRRRGALLDCMVAAAAVREGAPLATANPADFRRFAEHGLELVTA
jgi:predicted nucleic acid-binding protein